MCQNHSTSKVCKHCGQDKPLFDFHKSPRGILGVSTYCKPCQRDLDRERDTKKRAETPAFSRIAPCPDCGVFVALAGNRKKQRCSTCAAKTIKESNRIFAENKRRAKGVAPVKNTEYACIDCGVMFVRKIHNQKRCESCQYQHAITTANAYSSAKPRQFKIGDIRACNHCGMDYTVKSGANVYCPSCQQLSKTMKLPHLVKYVKQYHAAYMSDPAKRRKALNSAGAYRRKRIREDPIYCIIQRVRARIGAALREGNFTKNSTTQQIIGCTWSEFKTHIERQFLQNMTWGDRDAWHIDHIIPLSTAKTEADVIALNHFTNLRPLWAKDNIAKSDTVLHLI